MITLPSTGYIQVHAYASNAQIPLQNATIAVTSPDGTLLALRLTDRSGLIEPISLPVPDREESLTPNPTQTPFATVNLIARLQDYEQIFVDNVQVFPETVTDQELAFIPLSELPESRSKSETFLTQPQNL